MAYNPLQLRLNSRGQMVDKYGRVFSFDPERLDKVRIPAGQTYPDSSQRVWPSYHAHSYSLESPTTEADTQLQQKRDAIYSNDNH